MSLTREEIVGSRKGLKIVEVPTPEWADQSGNGAVFVRQVPASEADEAYAIVEGQAKGTLSRAKIMASWCVLGICDENGKRVLEKTDIPALLERPLTALQRCAVKIAELSGMLEEAERGEKKRRNERAKKVRIPTRKRRGPHG